jgi:hypothetical protein
MLYDMLYRHEKHTTIKITFNQANLCYSQIACEYLLLDGLRVQFQNVLTALSLAINLARL